MANKRDKSETRKLHEIEIKALVKRPLALVDKNSSAPLKSSIQRIGENIRAGTQEHDPLLQSIIELLKKPGREKEEKKLPKVWQQRFKELSFDDNHFIYIISPRL